MGWKILLLAIALIVAANAITSAVIPLLTSCFNSISTTALGLNDIVLDTGVNPNGGGDPVPGGGIPK